MLELLLPALACFGGSGLVTLLLLRLTREKLRLLRLLPLLAAAALWVLAWQEARTPSIFGGLNGLAALGKAIGGGLILLGWAVPLLIDPWKGR